MSVTAVLSKSAVMSVSSGFLFSTMMAKSVKRTFEDVLLALGLHFVGSNLVDAFKLELLHTVVAIVC